MKHLRNIFITLITLLSFNGVSVHNISLDVRNKSHITELSQKNYHFSIDSFAADTTPNEDFDLEEDTDDTEDDFLKTLFLKNIVFQSELPSLHSYSYSYSLQSVKRFILYCSLKLHC